ncbi:hypothetical protein HDU92_004808 [Lobulomyces angularis]|nr:hypothetical protein HDU92_004808 [Lobulomyces angularis]
MGTVVKKKSTENVENSWDIIADNNHSEDFDFTKNADWSEESEKERKVIEVKVEDGPSQLCYINSPLPVFFTADNVKPEQVEEDSIVLNENKQLENKDFFEPMTKNLDNNQIFVQNLGKSTKCLSSLKKKKIFNKNGIWIFVVVLITSILLRLYVPFNPSKPINNFMMLNTSIVSNTQMKAFSVVNQLNSGLLALIIFNEKIPKTIDFINAAHTSSVLSVKTLIDTDLMRKKQISKMFETLEQNFNELAEKFPELKYSVRLTLENTVSNFQEIVSQVKKLDNLKLKMKDVSETQNTLTRYFQNFNSGNREKDFQINLRKKVINLMELVSVSLEDLNENVVGLSMRVQELNSILTKLKLNFNEIYSDLSKEKLNLKYKIEDLKKLKNDRKQREQEDNSILFSFFTKLNNNFFSAFRTEDEQKKFELLQIEKLLNSYFRDLNFLKDFIFESLNSKVMPLMLLTDSNLKDFKVNLNSIEKVNLGNIFSFNVRNGFKLNGEKKNLFYFDENKMKSLDGNVENLLNLVSKL